MKKIKLILMMFLSVITLTSAAQGYVINGTTKGLPNGAVVTLIIHDEVDEPVEVVRTTVKGNKFTLKGSADAPFLGFLLVRGEDGGTAIFIENADFTAEMEKESKEFTITKGGERQQIANQFRDMEKERSSKLMAFEGEYEKLYKANHAEIDSQRLQDLLKRQGEFIVKWNTVYLNLIKKNSDSEIAATYIAWNMYGLMVDDLRLQYSLLSEKNKLTEYGLMLKSVLDKRSAKILNLNEYKLSTPEGKEVSMSDLKGKITVIDIWASWCGPCRFNNPRLVELAKMYKGTDLQIIGVSLDKEKKAWVEAIAADKLDWLQLSNLNGWESQIYRSFEIDGVPLVALLDKDNNVIATDLNMGVLIVKINELLSK